MRLLPLLLAVALVPLVPLSQARLDRLEGASPSHEQVLYLWSGEQVKRLWPGFEDLAADLYWLRTVQYFGGERLFASAKHFELLRPLIDITTTLDPRLEIAYRYGAIFLSEPPPTGAGRPREGIELLRKGTRSIPDAWMLQQQLGFFTFLFLHDAVRAAAVLNAAGNEPGAPFWLRTLAADLLAKGGDREMAKRMWQQMYEQSEPGVIKQNAQLRLRIYDSLNVADRLTALVGVYESRAGRRPRRLVDLTAAGLWRGPLRDAEGVPFDYDESTGRVSISRRSRLWNLSRAVTEAREDPR